MDFLLWYGVFAVLAWYQQVHWSKFNGSSQNFYYLLTCYDLLNLIFGFIAVYIGFKTIGWTFLITMCIAPLVMQAIFVIIENLFLKGHSPFKLSFLGLFFIPLSVWQITESLWSLTYVVALIIYFIPVFNAIIKNKRGE